MAVQSRRRTSASGRSSTVGIDPKQKSTIDRYQNREYTDPHKNP